MEQSKKVVKSLKVRSFRLIDFHIYDDFRPRGEVADTESVSTFSTKKTTPFVIQMFGINEKGETYSVFINDYEPFFYVLVPDDWQRHHCEQFREELCRKLGGATGKDAIKSVELVEYNKLYGFTAGKKSQFVKLVFPNMMSMSRTRNLWYVKNFQQNGESQRKFQPLVSHGVKTFLYESKLPPLLRYFHIQNISPSGWVYFPVNRVHTPPQKTTTCKYEFICSKNDLIPQPQKETRVPYKICSFDIEASSSHGDFPVPIKSYKRPATQIVDQYLKQHSVYDFTKQPALETSCIIKMLLAIFRHGEFTDIDIVYPKWNNYPTRDALTNTIIPQILSQHCLEDGEKGETGGSANVATIESLFEKMKQNVIAGGVDTGYDSSDEIENEDAFLNFEETVFCGEEDLVEEPEEDPEPQPPKAAPEPAPKKKASKKKQTVVTITILDVLKQDQYDRDEKVLILNRLLCNYLPPLEGDKVTFIGSTFLKYGDQTPYFNHCLVLDTCDPVPGVQIESVDDERDILLNWARLIQDENPDVIIGYNIFGFDYEFMFRRSQELDCANEFLQLARNHTIQFDTYKASGEPDLDNTKIVLATGEYDLRYPRMMGRIQIDMYTYFRRDFNLASYKLDDVAGQFIRDDVKLVEVDDGANKTRLYTNNIMGLHAGDYIHIEISGFTSDYYKDAKFQVELIVETPKGPGGEAPVARQIITIGSYEPELLEQSKSIKWCMAKDDVSPQDIFRLSNESAAGRARVAKYCIQDCNLVHHLMNKIDVITGYIEMASICSVPISFLVLRGQGIKLTSFVSKKCMEKATLMPDLEKPLYADGYEGAIVLSPKCAMYMDNPVACLDYASLYPSSMISNNISPDTKVWTKEFDLEGKLTRQWGERGANGKFKYDNLESLGYKYVDIEFDLFQWRRNPEKPKAKAAKTKVGTKICRWVQYPNNQKGIMPTILEELLMARSNTRKLAKTEKDPFMQNILDKRQLGYKVTANSVYGQCGARTSTFYEKDVAASTTATGRKMITYAKRIIEEVYGDLGYDTECHGPVLTNAEYVYGDSVAEYTPVVIRMDDQIVNTFIMDLARRCGGNKWVKCVEPGKEEKEYCEFHDVETWTENGWTPLHRVIRHKLADHKKMVRVVTDNGIVDVTDDHSLLTPTGTEISSNSCVVNETELLHYSMKNDTDSHVDTFREIRDGMLKYYENNKEKLGTTQTEETVLMNTLTHYDEIIDPNIAPFVLSLNIYKKLKESVINTLQHITIHMDASTAKSQFLIALVYHEFSMFDIMMKTSYSKYRNEYVLTYSPDDKRFNNKIRYMEPIPYQGYVYDLTTENHHFAAGVGNLIVHNTDSVFFTFNLKDPVTQEPIRGKKALEITIEIAQDAAHLCTQFLKSPMELSYEKTLMPFILLSKKRYVGMLYETDPNKGKLKYMGLSLKRRDSCDYLKDVYGGILNLLMKGNRSQYESIQCAVEFLDNSLKQLIEGNVSMDKLAITKALRGHYKNPQQIAHAVLAERIGKRDPGNKPKAGDRMKFVHIVNSSASKLQGDKIETPDYITQNNLQIDYSFYITNQLMKPLQQLFGLALETICDYKKKLPMKRTIQTELRKIDKEFQDDLEVRMKQREKYSSAKVKTLLFEHYLTNINNKKLGLRSIRDFF